jgi:DNA-binding CsgD family transcriptional regulator
VALLDLVESAYQLKLGEAEWLSGLLDAASPVLDAGLGLGAFTFDASRPDALAFSAPVMKSALPEVATQFSTALSALPPSMVEEMFWAPGVVLTVSQALGLGEALREHPLAVALAHPLGIQDLLAFKVADPSQRGVLIAAALPEIRSVTKRRENVLARCAAHIAAALRLRAEAAGDAVTEAVLDPGGRLQHAEGEAKENQARESLTEATRAMDRARTRKRSLSEEEALEIWQALVAGRWSLVDRFERDGKRFVVARRNEPEVRDPRGLSLRERQVVAYATLGHPVKLIAYELGLTPSTVSEHLKLAMRKLGAKTRAELCATVRVNRPDAHGK